MLVTRPRNEQAWADFLLAFVPLEEALPAEQRILAGNLLPLKGLSVTVRDNQVARREAKTARKQAEETRSETAGPLLDLLQLAFGMLVVTVYDGKVMPALHDWGFNIIQTPAKPGKGKDGEKKDEADEDQPQRIEYAGKNDYQFAQALNLLKGLQIMQNKAQ